MRTSASKAIMLAVVFTFQGSIAVSAQAYTLQETVQETVSTSPDVQITRKVKLAANEQVKQARAGYYPMLDVRAAYGRERSNNRNTLTRDLTTGADNSSYSNLWRSELSAELRENVFHGWETWYEVKRTKAKTDASSYLVCASAQDQALLATHAYIGVLRDREMVKTARRNYESHLNYHSIIKQRGESGVGREADLKQVQGRLAQAKSNLYSVENDLANSEALFYRITGLEPKNLSAPPIPGGRYIPNSLSQAINLALRFHPKMRTAVVDVEEARAQHNVSFRTAFPVVDLVAYAQNDRNLDGLEGPNKAYRLMGEMHYNLFNGGADMARQRETAYLTQEAAEVRNRTCRQVVDNMHLAWNAKEASESRLPLLREHTRASALSLDAYQEQFKIGKRSLLDVLDTENERFSADMDYIRGRYDALYSLYRILDAMGQLANFLQVKLPKEAQAEYNTYTDLAGPMEENRQYDAGLEQRDFPSKFYNADEPTIPNRPYVPFTNTGTSLDFAQNQIDGVFTPTNNPQVHSFKATPKHKHETVVHTKHDKKTKANTKGHRKDANASSRNAAGSASAENQIAAPINATNELADAQKASVPVSRSANKPGASESNPARLTPSDFSSAASKQTQAAVQYYPDENNPTAQPPVASQASQNTADNTAQQAAAAAQPAQNAAATPQQAVPVNALESPFRQSEQSKADASNQEAANQEKAAAGKFWAVKVGSYSSGDQVTAAVSKLQSNGFNGFVKEIKTANSTTTEVYAGPTDKRNSAVQLLSNLKKHNINGNVVSTEYDTQQS